MWVVIAFAVGTAAGAVAQGARDTDRGALVDRLGADLIEAARLPGLSISILRDGGVVFARGYGFADVETQTPVDTSTQFRAASVSKMITVTALARLYQEGQVDLDAPVQRYVSAWPEGEAATARLLAGHLAGVAHYQREDHIDRTRHYASVTEALGTFVGSPRAGPPGAQYSYSTHGFTLLSAVVESAAGKTFLDYLADDVFGPLGMTHSGPDLRASPPPTMSTLYGRRGVEPWKLSDPEDPSYKWGGGGLISRPNDLTRMAWGYLDGFIRPDVVTEMWASQRTTGGEETGVGIGWRVGEDHGGRRVIHHAGSMGGARSVIVIWPDERTAVSVMTNVTWGSSHVIFEAFAPAAEAEPLHGTFTYEGTLPATRPPVHWSSSTASGRSRCPRPSRPPPGQWPLTRSRSAISTMTSMRSSGRGG
jgi:CubicO group peptidase (beta-lactamase class C family)